MSSPAVLKDRAQPFGVGHLPLVRLRLQQHDFEQIYIAWVIFEEQNLLAWAHACGLPLGGNFTIVNQKSAIPFTTLRNCARSRGLVMNEFACNW